ncbi:caspase domain-containing protein [Irpex rosettiformis]|uniref:Caspase domain-containing protein n=1 Tax=Irpex rosettiformis TaxID=378272 RepID=A0ACB8UAA8_9APHY|nr:caspase domain-containing protein [Irpex rosettiformis]
MQCQAARRDMRRHTLPLLPDLQAGTRMDHPRGHHRGFLRHPGHQATYHRMALQGAMLLHRVPHQLVIIIHQVDHLPVDMPLHQDHHPFLRGWARAVHQQFPHAQDRGLMPRLVRPLQYTMNLSDHMIAGPPPRPPTQQQNYGPSFETANHTRQQPYFQYSQCTGKKKALCIGINYIGQSAALKGCINDANNVRRFLCTHFGYKQDDIVMLTDDSSNPRQIPTKQNILQAMQWLVRDAHPNDSLFFHYSGHGGQTKDIDGEEADGYDETIYPVDFKQQGHIVDDQMHDIMVKPLPAGCRLTAIFDSCHSGSALDLPYIYSTEGKVKEPNLAAEAGQGLLSAVTSYARGDMGSVFSSVSGIIKSASGGGARADKKARATKTSAADVISFSGCKDSQTSADTVEAGQSTGAMSFAFISVLSQTQQLSYQQLLINIRSILKQKYSQKPQLSASHPMDTNLLFIC